MINIIIIIFVYYNSNIYYLNVEFNKIVSLKVILLITSIIILELTISPVLRSLIICTQGGRKGGRKGGREGGRKERKQLQQYCTFNSHWLCPH